MILFNITAATTIIFVGVLSQFLAWGNLYENFDPDLHADHLKYYFNSYPEARMPFCNRHVTHPICKAKGDTAKACWGYELDCNITSSYQRPACPEDHKGWVNTKKEQMNTFYTQADFGFVRDQRNEMMVMCESGGLKEDSSLECSDHLRFCRGRNIAMNFTDLLYREEPIRYKMDVLKDGQVGGFCTLHSSRLKHQCDHFSPLQSWAPELTHFAASRRRPIPQDCDVVIDKPTFIVKIDATVNMYHHFCDFFNLYASLHVNSSHPETFSTDVHVLVWETYTYQSAFGATFEAFTRHPIWDLKTFRGKTVCFRNVVFPLLPRMIFGLYYNTPLIAGCERSGLFDAFSKHILHRLRIPFHPRGDSRIRITFLSRDTMYRKVLNERQLLHDLTALPEYLVNRVIYSRNMPFKQQLEITLNTDVFIGIHGAGLTHLLFLPPWAAIFELYNCEDPSCYSDLARLKGVKYITWQDKTKLWQQDEGHHPDGGAHAKFTNYKFDSKEFLRLVSLCANHVTSHPEFPGYRQQRPSKERSHDRGEL